MGKMTKRKQNDYFTMFADGTKIALRAALALQKSFTADADIDWEELRAIKGIEKEGDVHMHESLKVIETAFITPMDSQDMMEILRGVESITDSIEQISSHLYMMNIKRSDKYLDKFVQLLVESLRELVELTSLLHEFKKETPKLRERIIEVNHLEEVGDQTYMNAMHELFERCQDPIEIIRLQTLYGQMENALDCCEDVADTVEKIIISNS